MPSTGPGSCEEPRKDRQQSVLCLKNESDNTDKEAWRGGWDAGVPARHSGADAGPGPGEKVWETREGRSQQCLEPTGCRGTGKESGATPKSEPP